MLTKLVLVALVLSLHALEYQHGVPALLTQIRQLPSSSPRAQEFKNLLELELSQGSKVDEVVQLVDDLLTQLKNDQIAEDLEHATKMTALTQDVQSLSTNLENLSAERSSTNQFVLDTTSDLATLASTISNLQAQLALLNGREEDIRNIRADETIAFQHRSQNNNKVLSALQEILPRLASAVFKEQDAQGTSLLEAERVAIVEKINLDLGHKNPIAMLVSMTSKFDIGTVTRIIEKLENIRDAVMQSQVEENERDLSATSSMQTTLQELSDIRDQFSADYQSSSQSVKRKTNEKVIKERSLVLLIEDFETTESILLNTKSQRDQYDSNYQSRGQARAGEIKIVQAASDLLTQQSDKLKASQ